MKYKVVLFDLDGTLLDTLEDLAAAVNYALSLRGFPLHTLDEYRLMVGHGVRNLVMQALPEDRRGDALVDTCLAEFKAYYTGMESSSPSPPTSSSPAPNISSADSSATSPSSPSWAIARDSPSSPTRKSWVKSSAAPGPLPPTPSW